VYAGRKACSIALHGIIFKRLHPVEQAQIYLLKTDTSLFAIQDKDFHDHELKSSASLIVLNSLTQHLQSDCSVMFINGPTSDTVKAEVDDNNFTADCDIYQ
jgi:hypothetical protein